jgi:cytosine/uracil/thiamine/allantoin permease
MRNKKLKFTLHFLICFVISFVCIYLIIFFGGWRLFESGDPILLEIAAAIVIGFVIWLIYELSAHFECKIKELEKRIEKLEKMN